MLINHIYIKKRKKTVKEKKLHYRLSFGVKTALSTLLINLL